MNGDENHSAQERIRLLKFWPLTLVALLLGIALFGDRGVLHYLKLNRQKAEILTELDQIERLNRTLRNEISALKNDRRYIERLARTELGMVREDELVFQFTSKTRDVPEVNRNGM